MHPAATLAVCCSLVIDGKKEQGTCHAITQAINDFIKEARDEWFAG